MPTSSNPEEPYSSSVGHLPDIASTPIQVFSPAEIRQSMTASNKAALEHMQKVMYCLLVILVLLGGAVIGLGIYAGATADDDDCTTKIQPSIWTEINPSGAKPHARLAHAATSDGNNKMYIHGGLYGNNDTVFGDLWMYNEEADAWTEIETTGDVPSARFHHSITMTDSHTILLFGGFNVFNTNSEHKSFNDFYSLNLNDKVWRKITPQDATPGSHGAHDTFFANGALYMFGGFPTIGATGHKAELWKYVPAENKWTDLTPADPKYPAFPDGRIGFALTKVDDSTAMLWGGGCEMSANHSEFGQCDDMWLYNYVTNKWTLKHPDTHTYSPTPRRATHGDVSVGGIVYLFGGVHIAPPGPKITMLNDLHAYDPIEDKWMPIFPNFGRGAKPPVTFGHSVTKLGTKVVIFGGRAGSPASPGTNQLWEYHTIAPV